MRPHFARFWADDRGAVISVEMILILAILIFGIIPGLVALRNGVNSFLGSIANLFFTLGPSVTFSTTTIGGSTVPVLVIGPGGGGGFQVVGQQVPPQPINNLVVSPAP